MESLTLMMQFGSVEPYRIHQGNLVTEGVKMNSQSLGLRVAGVIFGVAALAQLLRLVFQPEVLVAGHVIPFWPNALALAVFGGLCAWMWRLSYRGVA
jgi:hypothetical protein